ncbi:LacI family DNA-binding transcriptional regulator [Bifidobacterium oedipodis]|uniref:LacI family transcriptional regulator n=1 Tax=Bifidobacterium oedipodis TaxID=2675322 RepID=A0A7Y0ERH8_9BIFI|nr:LacI family DNA-binding transcriptional regulator [Bifidobacterium sp. DSM 109957]NMM95106.1 LacI family transcriptional regulator [Bifidobacterium sp. DSM 109957]
MGQPILQDIADRVGVSVSTASRALSGKPVRESTRRKVVAAARELGYDIEASQTTSADGAHRQTVETSARASSKRIGLAVSKLADFFEMSTLVAVTETMQRIGYGVQLIDLEPDAPAEELVARLAGECDGMLLLSSPLTDRAIREICDPMRTVFVGRKVEGFSSVFLDENSGVRLALRHLASLGHRRVAYTSLSGSFWSNSTKAESIEHEAQELGMELVVLHGFETTYSSGLNAADALLVEPDVTAVLAHDEMLACGLVNRLVERGVRVPQDVSVVSMSDSSIATISRPALTAVDSRQGRMMHTACTMLLSNLALIDQGMSAWSAEHIAFPEAFTLRASTGPVRQ